MTPIEFEGEMDNEHVRWIELYIQNLRRLWSAEKKKPDNQQDGVIMDYYVSEGNKYKQFLERIRGEYP